MAGGMDGAMPYVGVAEAVERFLARNFVIAVRTIVYLRFTGDMSVQAIGAHVGAGMGKKEFRLTPKADGFEVESIPSSEPLTPGEGPHGVYTFNPSGVLVGCWLHPD